MLRKGEVVAVTVPRDWAESAGAERVLHHFKGDDYTEAVRTFAGYLVSVTDSEGLWFEGPKQEEKRTQTRILIPWAYISTIRTGSINEKLRKKIGF
jgi:hypothetical protein